MLITSLHNPRVKQVVKLRRRAGRDEMGCFLVEGVREIRQALLAELPLVQAFVCPALLTQADDETVAMVAARTELHEVTNAIWDKIAYGQRRDGLVVVAQYQPRELASLPIIQPLPIVVLDQVEKPGNAGAVFRTAAAAGVSAMMATDPKTDLCNPNAIRASLGAIFRVPWTVTDPSSAIQWLRRQGIPVVVADTRGERTHFDVLLAQQTCALVLGSEAWGVSAAWDDDSFVRVRIPMREDVMDSLNVATSAAILLYEALRQRGGAST